MSDNLSAEKQAQPNLDSLSKKVKELEERENATTWWFAVGLAAFIILVSGDLGAKVMRSAPPALTGLLLTLTLGTGITLVLSRASLRVSKRALHDQKTKKGERLTTSGHLLYSAATFILGPSAAAVFLVSAWWSVVEKPLALLRH
jgi:hypothetical protein